MVCLGNICRSPVAEGLMKSKAEQHKLNILVDSAGTSGWHEGNAPDERSAANALKHGVDIREQKSRPFKKSDFDNFDLIFAMDQSNYNNLVSICPPQHLQKVRMILNESFPGSNKQVPDPYWNDDGFDKVFKMLDEACEAIVKKASPNLSKGGALKASLNLK